jgi:hypothetical protein
MLKHYLFAKLSVLCIAVIVSLGMLSIPTGAFADEIETLERKLQYLKQRKALDTELQVLKAKIKALDEKHGTNL